MVVRHYPRSAVEAPIAGAPAMPFGQLDTKLRALLDHAARQLPVPPSPGTLELLKRAAGVLVYNMNLGRPITTVEALRVRVAPIADGQPAPGRIPRPCIGHDTVRSLFSEEVAPVIALAIRLGWFHGDFLTPTAITVFSTLAQAGRDSRALAVKSGMLPMIGIGIGSFDSFIINNLVELVHGTHHDPSAPIHDPDEIAQIVKRWGYTSPTDMPQLRFNEVFERLIAAEAEQRAVFEDVAMPDELDRAFPPDVVVQRLPHGPYARRLRTPAGEIMAKDQPRMAEIIRRHGYRAVLIYHETLGGREHVRATELVGASDLADPEIRLVHADELEAGQVARHVTVDQWNVDHYIVTGSDESGITKRRIARRARLDGRITIFDTVGYTDTTISDAVVLAEYATSNALRASCIDATVNRRILPGLLSASSPQVRDGFRLLAMLSSAATVALKRRAQAATHL